MSGPDDRPAVRLPGGLAVPAWVADWIAADRPPDVRPVLPLDQGAVEARAAAERAQTVELTCARPGCGAGYSSHRRPGSACAGFRWVTATPPPRTLGYHSTPESP